LRISRWPDPRAHALGYYLPPLRGFCSNTHTSLQDLQPVKSQEVRILRQRPPARAGMLVEHGEPDLLYGAQASIGRPGMIHSPIVATFRIDEGLAQENHQVVRKRRRPRLVINQQVARPGLPAVLADGDGVVALDRLRVGKTGKRIPGEIRRDKRTG